MDVLAQISSRSAEPRPGCTIFAAAITGIDAEIARRFKLHHAHVRRLLRFSYLAPDIVEAIVEGRQSRSLTVKRLLKGIAWAWDEQRKTFGFAA